MFGTLMRKELREQRRTAKLLIFLAVFFTAGMISPILAKYTPQLLGAIPEVPAELLAAIPDPTMRDAVDQYIKNTSQFGVLLVIVLTMGAVAQEKERGTAAMLLTKPVSRSAFILTKWLGGLAAVAAGLLLAGLVCAFYTTLLFEALPWPAFLALNLLMLVFFGVYLSIALLASTLARSQAGAAALAFTGLVIFLVLSSLPRIGNYMPGHLLAWGREQIFGGTLTAWPAFVMSGAIALLTIGLACWHFERQEI